eukprot:m.165852 g.165852  ORF g.165852 m.165852 type:complete len:313 (-) comp17743_c1_seq6:120-1058(-)
MAVGKDYYRVLEVTRSASHADVQKAYRQLSLRFHPDNNEAVDAAAKFAEVSEAYVVLSNPKLRATFDNFGYDGLTKGAPEGGEGYTEPFAFHGDAEKVFVEFFGTENPFQDIFPPYDEFSLVGQPTHRTRRKQDPSIERDLNITMEEAFGGCVKKMKITRQVLNDDGHTSSMQDKILTIHVKPGWKQGTKVTFAKDGDQGPNNIPADVVFVIKYKSHPRFVREGNDLVHTACITVADALAGCIVELLTLDGRKLNIPVNDVVTPGYEKRVPGEGMPITKSPGKRGDLRLKFDITFPTSLSEHQKALIRKALP